MSKILIATDGSPSADDAIEFGLELALEQQAEVVFVHVAQTYDVVPVYVFGMSGAMPHELTPEDSLPLDQAIRLATERGVRAETVLLRGDPADEIVAYADSIAAEMIIIGSRGHGAIVSALLGSVSRGVLRESRRPVVIVRSVPVRKDRSLSVRSPQSSSAGAPMETVARGSTLRETVH